MPLNSHPSRNDSTEIRTQRWDISRTKVGVCWTKCRPGDLALHLFETDNDFVDEMVAPTFRPEVSATLSNMTRFPKSNPQGDSGLRPSTTQIDDEKEGVPVFAAKYRGARFSVRFD